MTFVIYKTSEGKEELLKKISKNFRESEGNYEVSEHKSGELEWRVYHMEGVTVEVTNDPTLNFLRLYGKNDAIDKAVSRIKEITGSELEEVGRW